MVDSASLAALGVPLLHEAIKSLVTLAGDALRRWRERREEARSRASQGSAGQEATPAEDGPEVVTTTIQMPDILSGELQPIEYHLDRVEQLEAELKELRGSLANYAEGVEAVDARDPELVDSVDALRQALEVVIGQHITFAGEDRPASGPIVEGTVNVDQVRGDVAAVRARIVAAGRVKADAYVTTVEAGGKLTGVEADRIG